MANADIKLEDGTVIVEGNWLLVKCWDIKLDSPDRRSTSAGHRRALVHGFNDELVINWNGDYPGNVVVHKDLKIAKGGKLVIEDDTGNTVAKIDRHGNFEAGGNGEVDGDVLLNDKNGNRIIHIGADEGKIEIKDTSGNTVAKMDKFGDLYLGGGGRDGDIILKDGNGNVLIRIDTQYKRIDFKDPSGSVKMRICTDDFTEATWPAWPEESSPSQLDLIKELRRMKEEILALRERVEELESSSP